MLYLALPRPLLELCALPAEPSPIRCPRETRPPAQSFSQSLWLLRRKGWMSCLVRGHLQKGRLRGAASQHVGAFSRSIASTMRSSGRKLQKFRLGVEVAFSSEKSKLPREVLEFGIRGFQSWAGQRYLWTLTAIVDFPLVLRLGDHLKSLPTIFF